MKPTQRKSIPASRGRSRVFAMALVAAMLSLASLGLFPQPLPAQSVVILDETFDNDGGFAKFNGIGTPTTFFSDGTDSYLGISDGAGGGDFDGDPVPTGAETYGGADGSYLATEAVTGGGPLSYTLEWQDIDIAGYSDVQLSVDLASIGNTLGTGPFEAGDFLLVAVSVDGGVYEPLLVLLPSGDGYLEIDTDEDGVGDSERIAGTFEEYTPYFDWAPDGSSLDLRITLSSSAATEDIAIDNLRISGTPGNEWTLAGVGGYAEAGNWSRGQVPTSVDRTFIRNGGTALATSPGDPVEGYQFLVGELDGTGTLDVDGLALSTVDDLRVGGVSDVFAPATGTFTGLAGSLSIANASTVSIGRHLQVGSLWATGDAVLGSLATLVLDEVDQLTVEGDLVVGDPEQSETATVSSTVVATLSGLDAVTVGNDVRVSQEGPANDSGSGQGSLSQNVALLVDNVGTFSIAGTLYVGPGQATIGSQATTALDVTFRDVGLLDVDGVVNVLSGVPQTGTGGQASVNDASFVVRFEATTVTSSSFSFHIQRLFEDTVADTTVRVDLVDTAWTSTGASSVIGLLQGGGGSASNAMRTDIGLVRSSLGLAAATLRLGIREDATPGDFDATLDLDAASSVVVQTLNQGADGELRFHLDGPTSVLDGTVGQTGAYSAAAIVTGDLDGRVVADFDFVPAAGSHTFDLIESSAIASIDDTETTLSVEGLDPGFTVDFFGVVLDGTDIVRLMISGSPTPPLFTDGFESGNTSAWSATVN